MDDVKRYDLEQPDSHMGSAKMQREDYGDWVSFEDYTALRAEVRRWQSLFDEKHNLMFEQKARAERAEAALATARRDALNLSGVEEGDGFWKSCSGCHETNEGYETGHYPFSQALKCYRGAGCSECGGLGAVWDNTDYADMGRALANEAET